MSKPAHLTDAHPFRALAVRSGRRLARAAANLAKRPDRAEIAVRAIEGALAFVDATRPAVIAGTLCARCRGTDATPSVPDPDLSRRMEESTRALIAKAPGIGVALDVARGIHSILAPKYEAGQACGKCGGAI